MSEPTTQLRRLATTLEARRPDFDPAAIVERAAAAPAPIPDSELVVVGTTPEVSMVRSHRDVDLAAPPARRTGRPVWRAAAAVAAAAAITTIVLGVGRSTTDDPVLDSVGAPTDTASPVPPPSRPPIAVACPANPWTREHDAELGTGTDTSAGPRIPVDVPAGFVYTGSTHDRFGDGDTVDHTEDHYQRTGESPAELSVTLEWSRTGTLGPVDPPAPGPVVVHGDVVDAWIELPADQVDAPIGRAWATVIGTGLAIDEVDAIGKTVDVDALLADPCP